MRRHLSRLLVGAVVGSLAVVVPAASTTAVAAAEPPTSHGSRTVLAGGGYGWSGPASRAMASGQARVDVAGSGLVVSDGKGVLRVDPATDRVTVLATLTPGYESWRFRDVAARGSGAVVLTETEVLDVSGTGVVTKLASVTGGAAVDVGSDGVVWVATARGVLRILNNGTVVSPAPEGTFSAVRDLAVSPDGSRAVVLDGGSWVGAVWELGSAGLGPRLAGAASSGGMSIDNWVAPLNASLSGVQSIATDGSRIYLAGQGKVASFTAGGDFFSVHVASGGPVTVDLMGDDFVLGQGSSSTSLPRRWVRWTGAGLVQPRLFGPDPMQEWSPDGVRADDAYLGDVRGAAARPGLPTVFTTAAGQVREVGADGLLRTRTTLPRMTSRGAVALDAQGVAYVVTDSGGVVRVPPTGEPTTLEVDAVATDVEVAADGRLLVADATGKRVLRLPATGGTATVLATLPDAPTGLSVDGADALVAGEGLRRVAPDGTVTTLLSGRAVAVAASSAGPWVSLDAQYGRWDVLRPGRTLSAVRPYLGLPAQVQSDGAGAVTVAQEGTVTRVTDAGLAPDPVATGITAASGPGRVTLGWTLPDTANQVSVVAKRGTSAPEDPWDGQAVRDEPTVLRVGDEALTPGEQWSFSVFAWGSVWDGSSSTEQIWRLGSATAAAGVDTTAPPPATVEVNASRTWLAVGWRNPDADDLDRIVARMTPGATAPATPTDGVEIGSSLAWQGQGSAQVPDPVRGQDYAVSVFAIDTQGNWSRWSDVVRLDFEAPATPTGLVATPTYSGVLATFTAPTAADYAGVTYAVAEGDAVPARPDPGYPYPHTSVGAGGLTMDTAYTLAVWAHDRNGNVSEPAVIRFRTLLDTTPPAAPADLVAVGGSYRVTATWTPPTDDDLYTQHVTLLAADGTVIVGPFGVGRTASSHVFTQRPSGRTYRVKVVATDVNGLTSEALSEPVTTAPDENGAPPAVDPSTVTVTPTSSRTVAVSFPRPSIPDLRGITYAFVPKGAPTDAVVPTTSLTVSSSTVRATLTLPEALTEYQLVLVVTDLDNNRARSVVPGVKGVVTALDLPPVPSSVGAASPSDNTLAVSWTTASNPAVVATEWVITLTSGSLSRTVVVPGGDRSVVVRDLAGRVGWTASVAGRVALGTGPARSSVPISVGDSTPPALASSFRATPSYDSQTLTWVNPTPFDFSHVVVTQKGPTAAETKELYRGRGTTVRTAGLRAGRAYTYEVATYDTAGQTATTPARLTVTQAEVLVHLATTAKYGIPSIATNQVVLAGRPVVGKKVVVQAQKVGSTTWSTVTTLTTNSTGHFLYTVQPSVSTRYRFGFAGVTGIGGAWSTTTTVTLAPAIAIRTSRNNFGLGGSTTLSTTVAPNHRGRTIILQRWNGSAWKTVTSRVLSSTSTASATVKPPARGINSYRWFLAAHTDHGTGTSTTMRLTVR